MSQENLDLAHQAYAALQEGDFDEFLSYFDPEVEFKSLVLELEGVFHGHDGVRQWWEGLLAAFPDWNPSLLEVRDLDDRVLIHASATGRGAASGIGIEDDFWQLVEVRNGRVVSYAAFRTQAEALEAAGLRE
jgi:ketosteroid isomerase-like protein